MKTSRLITLAAWGLVAFGLILRLRQYLANRSLWLDEAMLALNIIHKDIWGLFGKLDYEQGAPLGFLLLEKLAATLLGDGERALRLLPLLAGCASLVLFYLLARQILRPPGLLIALALFALSPTLIYYASEVKQYAFDVFITLLLLYLFARNRQSLLTHNSSFIIHHSVFLLAPWFSHPAIFVLAAIGLTLLIQNRRTPLPTLAMGAGWLFSFGILYLVNLRGLSQNEFLRAYWQEYFRANPLTALAGLFANPAGLTAYAPLLLAAMLFGAAMLLARQQKAAGSLLLIFFFAWAASWLQLYPLAGRMALFLVPLIYIFLASAVDCLWHIPLRPRFLSPLLALSLAGFLLYTPLLLSAERFISPKYPEHIRPAIAYLNANHQPGDTLYVYYWALPAFRYYARPDMEYVAGGLRTDDPQALLAELAPLRGQPRVWFLFSHVYERKEYNERDWMLDYLDQIGQRKRQFIEPGTSVYLYLYDLRQPMP
ncbi:MAG: hypothetical protein Fur0016_21010 [Anaerolineales bacterium]